MPVKRPKPRRPDRRPDRREPAESQVGETLTVAWTVSVTGVVIADLMLLSVHLLVRGHPEAQRLRMLEIILLLLAAGMAAISLALLPVVWQKRRVKPPQGYIAFAVLVAAAPIAALLVRLLT